MQTDYLVKGGGAMAMAFVDAMLKESDATFTIVDQRAAPGGHWNDAYPFVRLHQPSACYGVGSKPLGRDRIDQTGFNQGLNELASGIEVADYFHQVMRDEFLPSGRVAYHPMSEVVGELQNGEIEVASLLSGRRQRVAVKRKLVDGTMIATSIPLTHKRKFTVADGVVCIPPNDLTRRAPDHDHFTVLGAGKTAIDSILWLLTNGAPREAITWVLPRDPWLVNRATGQPGLGFFDWSIGKIAEQYEICAQAASERDLCERMEAAQIWLRLDPDVWPTMMHGATVAVLELEQLRLIERKIRLGRVQALTPDKIVLDQGEVPTEPGALYVDCTARALARNVNDRSPVFDGDIIRLQMIRQYQPTFSAALIGHLEAIIEDEAEKRALATVTPMTDTVADFIPMLATSMINQGAWMARPDLRAWIRGSRLDLFGRTVTEISPEDRDKQAVVARVAASAAPAVKNLMRLAQAA